MAWHAQSVMGGLGSTSRAGEAHPHAPAGVDVYVYLLLPVEYTCAVAVPCSIALVRLGRPAWIRMLYRLPCSSPIVLGGVRRTMNDPGRARRRSYTCDRSSWTFCTLPGPCRFHEPAPRSSLVKVRSADVVKPKTLSRLSRNSTYLVQGSISARTFPSTRTSTLGRCAVKVRFS